MVVSYYDTIIRDINIGTTMCYMQVKTKCDFAKNGIIKCYGVLPALDKGTPLNIEGNIDNKNGVFVISSHTLLLEDEHNSRIILDYISNKLTDSQINKIIDLAKGNLFSLLYKENAEEEIKNIFKRSKNADNISNIVYEGIQRLKEYEDYASLFIKYQIPLDSLDEIINNSITLSEFKDNPYLILIKQKVPIERIDELAINEHYVEDYSIKRLCGFVLSCVYADLYNGNTCISFGKLKYEVDKKMKACSNNEYTIPNSVLYLCINELYKYIHFKIYNNELYIYLNEIRKEEDAVINGLRRLYSGKKSITPKYSIEEVEHRLNIKYNEGQRDAFNAIHSSGVKVLTGPPGSGKTMTIQGLLMAAGLKSVKLSATTGMAAQVMSVSCNAKTSTVHKMLNIIPYGDGYLSKNTNEPIDADIIIVDEFSMAGLKLSSVLFNAIQNNCILLLVGDEDQLESVDYGNVLHDLIGSKYVEVYRLTEVMRSSGIICQNAQKINNGVTHLDTSPEFTIHNCFSNDEAKDIFLKNYVRDKNTQVLCPVKKGSLCTETVYLMLENIERPLVFTYGQKNYRLEDKVVMTENNYDKDYINGDIGYITSYGENSVTIEFANKILSLSHEDFKNIAHAEAITIHKSQGSEYNTVHIILPQDANFMMSRKLLYTAVTRAKSKVVIYSVNNSIYKAINNTYHSERITLLGKILKEEE